MFDIVVQTLAVVFACALLIAVVHKVGVLGRHQAAAQPLILVGRWTRKHSAAALTLAIAVELACIALLLADAGVGFVAFAGLMIVYIWRLRLLGPQEDCDCFGGLVRSGSADAAIRRNVLLAAAALVAACLIVLDVARTGTETGAVAVVVLVLFVAAAAVQLVNRQFGSVA